MEDNRVPLKQKVPGEKRKKEQKKLKRKLRDLKKQKLLNVKKNDVHGALQILYTSITESDSTGVDKAELQDFTSVHCSTFDVNKKLLEIAAEANPQFQNGDHTENLSTKKKSAGKAALSKKVKAEKKKKKLFPKQQMCGSKVENHVERYVSKPQESKSEFSINNCPTAKLRSEKANVHPIMIEINQAKESVQFTASVSKMKTSLSPASFNFKSVSSTLRHPAYSHEDTDSFAEYGCAESLQINHKDSTLKAIDCETMLAQSIAKLLNPSLEDSITGCNGSVSDSHLAPENDYEFFIIGGDKVLLLMKHPCILFFRGVLQVEMLAGAVEVLGYKFKSDKSSMHTIYSARGSSLLGFQACELESDASEDIEQKLASLEIPPHILSSVSSKFSQDSSLLLIRKMVCPLLPYLSKYFPVPLFDISRSSQTQATDVQSCLQCEFMEPDSTNPTKCYMKSSDWEDLVESLNLKERAQKECLRIIMFGGKSVGKSTCLRFLINRCLDDFGKVLYIDLDPGQSEFTVPGCVSAVVVQEPLLGPSFTHMAQPRKMVNIGNVNVAACPMHYLQCVQYLLKWCASDPELSTLPWFINTMGFSQGLGVDLAVNIIKRARPSNLIQIESHSRKRNFPQLLTPSYVAKHASSIYVPEAQLDALKYDFHSLSSVAEFEGKDTSQWGLEARKLRELNILSYFHKLVTSPSFSLLSSAPYVKPFANLKLCICHERVKFSQYLSAMNGNLVALCQAGDVPGALKPNDDRYPQILEKAPLCDCLGFGIVRGVDMEQQQVYITTPLGAADMESVDCLVLGPVSLPATVYMQVEHVVGRVPYVVRGAQPVMSHTLRATRSLVAASH